MTPDYPAHITGSKMGIKRIAGFSDGGDQWIRDPLLVVAVPLCLSLMAMDFDGQRVHV